MGVDNWCSRSWNGSLFLLVVLAGTPGCNALLGEQADIPDGSPPNATVVPRGVAPAMLAPAALVEEFPDAAPQQALCGDPLLGPDFALDDSELPTLYVDAASNAAEPDGSLAAPFRTLSQALASSVGAAPGSARALGATRRVLAASGYYDEDVAVPPGTLLFGGYDAQTWQQGAEQSVISGSSYLGVAVAPASILSPEGYLTYSNTAVPESSSNAPLTALTHFVLSAGVKVVSGTRALLRDSVIAPVFFSSPSDPPDARRAMAVWIDVATVRADRNRLVMTAGDPATIISNGFAAWNSCAWISENQISDYRSPISFDKGPGVAATFNVMERAENGIGTSGNRALIAGNAIYTHMPLSGCVYAISMDDDAHPDIRDNTIFLGNWGNRGILEIDIASRPNALLGNRFFSVMSSANLYIHHRGIVDPELITTVGAVNALSGVPAIGGNTFSSVVAEPTKP